MDLDINANEEADGLDDKVCDPIAFCEDELWLRQRVVRVLEYADQENESDVKPFHPVKSCQLLFRQGVFVLPGFDTHDHLRELE